jgi:hypothetical protein
MAKKTATNGDNAHFAPLVISISLIGCLCIVGISLICILVNDTDRVITYVTLLTTFAAMIMTTVLSIGGTLRKLTAQTNSRMDQLIESTRTIAYAAGKMAERTEEARRNLDDPNGN